MMIQVILAQIDSCEEIVVVGEEQSFTSQPQREEKKHLGKDRGVGRSEVSQSVSQSISREQ